MTPQERQLIDDLFDRLAKLESAPRDPDAAAAIAQGLRTAPNAVYALVQTVLVQDEALKRANSRIQELEAGNAPEPNQSGGFLDSMRDTIFGQSQPHGSVPNVPPPEIPAARYGTAARCCSRRQPQGHYQGQYDRATSRPILRRAAAAVRRRRRLLSRDRGGVGGRHGRRLAAAQQHPLDDGRQPSRLRRCRRDRRPRRQARLRGAINPAATSRATPASTISARPRRSRRRQFARRDCSIQASNDDDRTTIRPGRHGSGFGRFRRRWRQRLRLTDRRRFGNKRPLARAAVCGSSHRATSDHDDPGADIDAAIEVDHVLVAHPDAAGRHVGADRPGLVGAVDAIERGSQIHRARAERILRTAFHVPRQIGTAHQHFRRRGPVRPFLLGRNRLDARPGESRACRRRCRSAAPCRCPAPGTGTCSAYRRRSCRGFPCRDSRRAASRISDRTGAGSDRWPVPARRIDLLRLDLRQQRTLRFVGRLLLIDRLLRVAAGLLLAVAEQELDEAAAHVGALGIGGADRGGGLRRLIGVDHAGFLRASHRTPRRDGFRQRERRRRRAAQGRFS